jgi:tetratricopeptide (TPR) repeat protein
LLTRAAALPDARPWVYYTLGLSQFALGRPLDAIVAWERVRQAEPEFDAVYVDLADAYLQVSEVTRALEVLREGSRRWPSNPEFHNAIGVIHVRRGALDEGIAAFTRAAEAEPQAPLAWFNLGRAYEMRFARSYRFVRTEGRWMANAGDRRKAVEHYERCIRLGGPYVRAATEALHRLEWSR